MVSDCALAECLRRQPGSRSRDKAIASTLLQKEPLGVGTDRLCWGDMIRGRTVYTPRY